MVSSKMGPKKGLFGQSTKPTKPAGGRTAWVSCLLHLEKGRWMLVRSHPRVSLPKKKKLKMLSSLLGVEALWMLYNNPETILTATDA